MQRMMARCRPALAGLLLLCLSACVGVDYYLHTVTGHLQVISKRKSIHELLQQPSTPQQLQQQLARIEQIRDFASEQLQLPDNDSYRSYVQLDRPYVVWNVIAAPEFSLQPLQWCFPIAGCANYRGYFAQDKAEQFADQLAAERYDTLVVGVPAYSTLNWFADPVLSTFSSWPTVAVAGLLFHELAHQQLYLPGDTVFNESFATAVAEAGIERWLQQQQDPTSERSYRQQQQRQQQFQQLLLASRAELETLYAGSLPPEQMRAEKQQIFSKMQQRYRQLRHDWDDYPGYDNWFEPLNNARFASVDNYHRWVPAFRQALRQEQGDLAKFYWRCQMIAEQPKAERERLLTQLSAAYRAEQEQQP